MKIRTIPIPGTSLYILGVSEIKEKWRWHATKNKAQFKENKALIKHSYIAISIPLLFDQSYTVQKFIYYLVAESQNTAQVCQMKGV